MFEQLRSRCLGGTVSMLVVVGLLPLTTAGCFAGFELTGKVYQFNKDVDPNKWMQWLAFLGMSILPVYGFAVVIDVLFANSVEFWTGENPVLAGAEGETRVVEGPAGENIVVTRTGPGVLRVEVTELTGERRNFTLAFEQSSLAAYADDGSLLGRVGDRDGGPVLLAGSGVPQFSAVR